MSPILQIPVRNLHSKVHILRRGNKEKWEIRKTSYFQGNTGDKEGKEVLHQRGDCSIPSKTNGLRIKSSLQQQQKTH